MAFCQGWEMSFFRKYSMADSFEVKASHEQNLLTFSSVYLSASEISNGRRVTSESGYISIQAGKEDRRLAFVDTKMDSSRISLRPFKLSDADDFLKWASDDKVTHYLRWNTITSKEEALLHIQQVAMPHPWRHSICLDDQSIGYISVRPELGDDRHRAHMGYAIGSDYWGLGIVTTAIKMAIPRVFEKFPFLVRLEALVEEENVGSQRVLEKVGFVKEGFLRKYGFNKGEIRDMFIYSFLKSDEIAS